MKLNKKLIRLSFVSSLMLVGFIIANPYIIGAANDDEVEFPTFDLYIDGTADVSLNFLKNSGLILPTPDNDFLSLDVGFEMIPENQVFSESLTIHKVTKIDFDTWRLSFTTVLNAPLINIWESPSVDKDLSLSITEKDIRVITEDEAQSEEPMGLSFFYGSVTTLLENDTEDSFTTFTYATDFDLDSYNILYLEDFNSKGSSNVSIAVSYVETTSYVNLNSTYAYNKTIYNEFVAQNDDVWFRLDLENTNSTFDEHVAHIAISNLDSNGLRSILRTAANTTDTRYGDIFVGDFDTAITLSSTEPRKVSEIVGDPIRVEQTSLGFNELGLSGFWNDIGAGDILALPGELVDRADDVVNEARGWDIAETLENKVKDNIVALNSNVDSREDLDNLQIDSAVGSWGFAQNTMGFLQGLMGDGSEVYDTVSDVVGDAKDQTFETIEFATDIAADTIETVGTVANDAKDVTVGVFASAKEKVSNFGSDVKDAIVGVGNKIKNGLISIVSKAKDLIGGGLSKLAMYALVAIIAIIVILVLMKRLTV